VPLLSGKHALVTGGSRGIGEAVAALLLQNGARVTLLARDEARLMQTAKRLSEFGEVSHVVADVTQRHQVNQAVEQASSRLGSIAILVNNAGHAASVPFLHTDDRLWRHMLDVNLNGTYHCIQAVLPAMRDAGSGRIVNVASSAGLQGYAYVTAYCAAKHAVVGLTRALAQELAGSGVTINAVCPGYTDTDMLHEAVQAITKKTGQAAETIRIRLAEQNPDKRLLSPNEVARAVVRFCLPDASQFNGDVDSFSDGAPL
jgi:3-hydroxybutyrate dehydrogenase